MFDHEKITRPPAVAAWEEKVGVLLSALTGDVLQEMLKNHPSVGHIRFLIARQVEEQLAGLIHKEKQKYKFREPEPLPAYCVNILAATDMGYYPVKMVAFLESMTEAQWHELFRDITDGAKRIENMNTFFPDRSGGENMLVKQILSLPWNDSSALRSAFVSYAAKVKQEVAFLDMPEVKGFVEKAT